MLDFGIAKVFGELATVKTRTGLLMCTPAYAPPELLRQKEIGPATDIYSLGLILLEMVTGKPAIVADSEVDLIAQQISPHPIAIPHELAGTPLGQILVQALQKDAAQRYRDADQMLSDLQRLGPEPISAPLPGPPRSPEAPASIGSTDRGQVKPSPRLASGALGKPSRGSASSALGLHEQATMAQPQEMEPKTGTPAEMPNARAGFITRNRRTLLYGIAVIAAIAIAVAVVLLAAGDRRTPPPETGGPTVDGQGQPSYPSSVSPSTAQGDTAKPPAPSTAPPAVPEIPIVPPTGSRQEPAAPVPEDANRFVLVRAGTFLMGSSADEPGRQDYPGRWDDEVQHAVTITRDFHLLASEVTQKQWQTVMGNNPSAESGCISCPVEQVNWWEALSFCNVASRLDGLEECYVLRGCSGQAGEGMTCTSVEFSGLDCAGYRLPTEAEWEYAARAGTTTARYCGADERCLSNIAWYNESRNRPHPVGGKSPNPWGFYDMLGNVWEWTWDWYTDYPEGPVIDPLGPDAGTVRVIRGGGMASVADEVRAAQRDTSAPYRRSHNLGFRVARTQIPSLAPAMDPGQPSGGLSDGSMGTADQLPVPASQPAVPVAEIQQPDETATGTPDAADRFVRIRAGTFLMGSPVDEVDRQEDELQHEVTISRDYFLQATEVTQGQWRALMGNNPSRHSGCGDNCPVEQVTWYEALAYCNALSRAEGLEECYTLEGCWNPVGENMMCGTASFAGLDCLGYRLPTEAEWEYAARAGTTTSWYCGADWNCLSTVAWWMGNSGNRTHPVGVLTPNAWGLYDMLGNVWEWTWDWYTDYPEGPVTDPLGPDSVTVRVIRGGSYDCSIPVVRAAERDIRIIINRGRHLGFRPARTAGR
ncbi:MAG: SUMF1/EgtB/PvdO family nonheme iron enzyme [Bradymonadales bacterium]|nr:SUMF1/EgtB/PvdO family nonheme iron enzyme [Bradymonadales bacterium]